MVVGSGYIAVELAGILNTLGSEVSLVVRYHKCLRSFDDILSDSLMEEMANAGINIVKFSTVSTTIEDEKFCEGKKEFSELTFADCFISRRQ